MTQHDAKTAVRHLRRNFCELQELAAKKETLSPEFLTIMNILAEDLADFDRQLHTPKQATPNCRPATKEELERLCLSSNVVMFPAVA